jgi:hypothetical protein
MGEKVRPQIRAAVSERAGGRCEYCQVSERFSAVSLSVDHIFPQSLGGDSTPDNLCLACQGCNNRKYTALEVPDPVTKRTVPLFNPRTQAWHDHFAWSSDSTTVIARTAIGRATLHRLRLNRSGVVSLRRALVAIGEHPPAS